MEIRTQLDEKANLKKCDNSKLPDHLKDLTEGDQVIIKTHDELKDIGVGEDNPVYFLSGRGFVVSQQTIYAIENNNGFVAQLTVDARIRQILVDAGYKGKDLNDDDLINIELPHIKYPCAKAPVKEKIQYSLKEASKDKIDDNLIKEMISKVDRETLKKQFQIPMSIGRKPMKVPDAIIDMYLEKWARSKAIYYLIFDRNLSISKKIEYAMEENEMNCLVSELIRKYPKYALNLIKIPSKYFVDNKMPDGIQEFKMYFGEDYSKGMKVSKFLSAFGDKDFDNDVSAIMQERTVKGFLTLSIDPYDYMTHAISMHGWGSCHSPVSGCHPTSSFMYMIDECTVVAYKHNGKTYTYDKGMYRDVDSHRNFNFEKNAFQGNSKSFRQLICVDPNTTTMVFSREYPKRTTSDDLRTQVRTMFEDVVAKYLGIESIWANYGDNLTRYKAKNTEHYYSDIAHYRDLRQSYGDTVKMDYVGIKDADISKSAVVDGTNVFCLNCGEPLRNSNVLCEKCCH